MKLFTAFVISLLLAGCAMWTYYPTGERLDDPTQHYSVQIPAGWVRFMHSPDRVLLTRDGPNTQQVVLAYTDATKTFPKTKQAVKADTLPQELSEMTIAELRNSEAMANLKVLDNQPAMLAGQPGFRVHLRYKTPSGLTIDQVTYGASLGKGVLMASYTAPRLHYFARDLQTFEGVVQGLKAR